MFKDVFVLKKNAYHARMMKYIWGLNHYDFSHICPYWWLSVFNHIVFLPVFTVKEGFKLLVYLCKILWKGFWIITEPPLKAIQKWLDEGNRKREIRRQARLILKREKEAALWKKWSDYYKAHPEKLVEIKEKKESVFDRITNKLKEFHYRDWQEIKTQVYYVKEKMEEEKWILEAEEREKIAQQEKEKRKKNFLTMYKGDNVESLLVDGTWEGYLTKMEQQKKQSEIEKEAARRRAAKERINKILRIIKVPTTIIAYTLGTAAVLFGLYWVFRFFKWVIDGINSVPHKEWVTVGSFLGKIGLGILALALLVGIIISLIMLFRTLSEIGYKWPRWLTFRRHRVKDNDYWDREERKIKMRREKARRREEWVEKYIFKPILAICKFFQFIWFKIICRVARGIRNAVLFLIQMLKNNCPAIEWKD